MTQYNASEQTQFRLRIVTTSIGGRVIANGCGDGSRSGTGVARPVYRPGLYSSRLGHRTRYSNTRAAADGEINALAPVGYRINDIASQTADAGDGPCIAPLIPISSGAACTKSMPPKF